MEKDRNRRSETMLNQHINCLWAGEAGFNICRGKKKNLQRGKKKSNLVLIFSRWIEMQIFESGRYPYIYFFPFLFYIEEEIDLQDIQLVNKRETLTW